MALPPSRCMQNSRRSCCRRVRPAAHPLSSKNLSGYNYASAVELNAHLVRYFDEPHIFRNDHYLAKRKRYRIFWYSALPIRCFIPCGTIPTSNRFRYTAGERPGCQENAAAILTMRALCRDMVQNTVSWMQLLCLLYHGASCQSGCCRIYPPVKLKCCVRYTLSSVFRSQYEGYRSDPGLRTVGYRNLCRA